MSKFPEKNDLNLVSKFFIGHGFKLQSFSKTEIKATKTPDFKLLFEGEVIGFCEVKSPQDSWLQERAERASPDQLYGGVRSGRSDPIVSRISGLIEKAYQQFEAVNQPKTKFNILTFVNHDSLSGFSDLNEALTGNLFLDNGTTVGLSKGISEGRLKKIKKEIDLYIWFQPNRKAPSFFIGNSRGKQFLHDSLGK